MSGYVDYFFSEVLTYFNTLLSSDFMQLCCGLMFFVIVIGCFRKLIKVRA